ncbi:MAG: UDP-N-acetylgalactosaminyltransferase [Hungatella sp.]|nr:UDP-N-acetylgalactosaminyltransferase [Hungatella sp.]
MKTDEKHIPHGFYEAWIKRLLDVALSTAALLLFSPVMGLTALLIRIKLGTPVLFIQDRPGKDGKVFKLYKFRTMTNKRGEDGNLLPDEKRLTNFGRSLRSTSLDELPELVNIIKGDMSIVGPRPLLVEYLPRYDHRQRHRHDVRPGLTGLAQVNGRNRLSWEERFEDDLKYVKRITFLADVKIILKTIAAVWNRTGICSDISETMDIFMGSGRTLTVIGASGHGKVVADIAKRCGYGDIVFFDDNPDIKFCGDYPISGQSRDACHRCGDTMIAIGNAKIRQKIQQSIENSRIITLIHPDAVIADDVEVGRGSVVMAGAVINPGTRIGDGCIINTSSSVDHDCFIGNFVHISVGAHVAGNVTVGSRTWVGAGATISNNVCICEDCMIDAGAVVVKDLEEAGTYVGVPARRIKTI